MKIIKFLSQIIDDIFIFLGLSLIAGITFYISPIIGCYVLGAILVSLGVLMAKK